MTEFKDNVAEQNSRTELEPGSENALEENAKLKFQYEDYDHIDDIHLTDNADLGKLPYGYITTKKPWVYVNRLCDKFFYCASNTETIYKPEI